MSKKEKGNEKAFPKTEDVAEAAGEAVGPTGGRAGEVVEHSEDWTDAAPDDGGAGVDGAAGGAANDAAGEAAGQVGGAGGTGPDAAELTDDDGQSAVMPWKKLSALACSGGDMIEWATELVNNLPDDEIRTEQSFSTIADFFRDYPDAPMLAGIQQCRLKKIELPDDLANETPRGLFQLRVLHAIVLAGLDYMKAQAAALAARQDMPTPTPPQPHELREELADEPFAATGFSGR